jgi:serine/threonine protein kinase
MAVPSLPAGYALQEYRIEKMLGVGGFGLTYLAIDTNLKLRVALKEYLPGEIAARGADQSVTPNSSNSAEDFMWGKRRFLDESRTLASFRHPNIVRVMRFFEANGSAYMVMEYVEGDALPDWIKPRRPLGEKQIAALAGPLLDGLVVVHNAGYLHRDIKPSNIFVRYDGSPVLLDFGSARQKNNELTAIVTPGYAPFEQYHTQGKQGPWSDLYALAGVLYWMTTGNRPLEAPARVRQDTMAPAVTAAKAGRYRPEFLAAIDWALAPNEEDRPKSVSEWSPVLLDPDAQPKTLRTLTVAGSRPAPDLVLQPTALPQPQDFDAGFLAEVERELAQHLGPIAQIMVRNAAKKARDSSDLVQQLAADITQPGLRIKFERRFAELSRPLSRQQPSTAPSAPSQPRSARFSAKTLAEVEARLAEYLGPVAKMVVRLAAARARDESELYLLVADEIENPAEKKAFIRRAISSKV